MNENPAYVITGASLAGAKAAETLRKEGFDGPLILIGEEAERPYERPPLSRDYLLGKAERDAIYVHPQQWYAEQGIDLRLGVRVTGVDPAAHQVRLADGRVLAGMNVNVWDINPAIQDLVRAGRTVDAGRLADPGVPLEAFLGA